MSVAPPPPRQARGQQRHLLPGRTPQRRALGRAGLCRIHDQGQRQRAGSGGRRRVDPGPGIVQQQDGKGRLALGVVKGPCIADQRARRRGFGRRIASGRNAGQAPGAHAIDRAGEPRLRTRRRFRRGSGFGGGHDTGFGQDGRHRQHLRPLCRLLLSGLSGHSGAARFGHRIGRWRLGCRLGRGGGAGQAGRRWGRFRGHRLQHRGIAGPVGRRRLRGGRHRHPHRSLGPRGNRRRGLGDSGGRQGGNRQTGGCRGGHLGHRIRSGGNLDRRGRHRDRRRFGRALDRRHGGRRRLGHGRNRRRRRLGQRTIRPHRQGRCRRHHHQPGAPQHRPPEQPCQYPADHRTLLPPADARPRQPVRGGLDALPALRASIARHRTGFTP